MFGKKSMTEIGIYVNSLKEKLIADYLTANNIYYEYEKKIYYTTFDCSRTYYIIDDFYLTEYDIHVEYLGLINLPGIIGDQYRKRLKKKFKIYRSI